MPGPNIRLGTVTHLPPTLTAKYYFGNATFKPYLGAGVSLTWFVKDDLAVPLGGLHVDSLSVGPALQAGFDVALNSSWALSFDAKRAWIRTDVSLGSTTLTTVKVDPWIFGVGLGYRFGQRQTNRRACQRKTTSRRVAPLRPARPHWFVLPSPRLPACSEARTFTGDVTWLEKTPQSLAFIHRRNTPSVLSIP